MICKEDFIDSGLTIADPDYHKRFKAELVQIEYRIHQLQLEINSWELDELPLLPSDLKALYKQQLEAMKVYRDCLLKRREIENVKY